jgi:hypothetical protein
VIKYRRLAGHAESMGTAEVCIEFWWRNQSESQLDDIGIERKILKCILKKPAGLIWLGIRTNGGVS